MEGLLVTIASADYPGKRQGSPCKIDRFGCQVWGVLRVTALKINGLLGSCDRNHWRKNLRTMRIIPTAISASAGRPVPISWRWRPTAPPANAGPDPHHHFFSVLPYPFLPSQRLGTIIVNRADDLEIKERCRQSGSRTACTYPPTKAGEVCFMWIVYDDILNIQRMSYDVVFRHERAHCNGWHHLSSDHHKVEAR